MPKKLTGKRKVDEVEGVDDNAGKKVKEKHSSLNAHIPRNDKRWSTPYTVDTLPKIIESKEELPLIGNVAYNIDPDDYKSIAKLIKFILDSFVINAAHDKSKSFHTSIGVMKSMAGPMRWNNSDSLAKMHEAIFDSYFHLEQRDEFLKYVSSQVKKGVPFSSEKMAKLLSDKLNQLLKSKRHPMHWWPQEVAEKLKGTEEDKGEKKVKGRKPKESTNKAKKVNALKEFRASLPEKLAKENEAEIVRIAKGIEENDYISFIALIRFLKAKKASRSLLDKVVQVGPKAFRLAVQALLIDKLPAKEIVLFMENHQNIPFGSSKMSSWLEEKINSEREEVVAKKGAKKGKKGKGEKKTVVEKGGEKKMAKKGNSSGGEKKAATEKKGAKPTSRVSSKPARAKKPRCEGGHFCGTIISIKKIFRKEGYQSNDEACKMIKEYYRKEGKEMYEQLMGNLLRQMKAQKKKRVTQGMVTAAIESI